MAYFIQHWLSIGAGVFLLSMILYGHYKGMIRLAVTILALVSTMVIVRFTMPYVTDAVQNNEIVHNALEGFMLQLSGINKLIPQESSEQEDSAIESQGFASSEAINALPLPQKMKDALLENDSHDVYEMLGVNAFSEYVGNYLANYVIRIACLIILSITVFLVVRLVFNCFDFIAKIPIISGINKIAGAAFGAAEGLLILWLLFLIVPLFLPTKLDAIVIAQIQSSGWLSFLYNNNALNWFFTDMMRNLF